MSKYNPKPPSLQEGYYLDQYFDNYEMLNEGAKNWSFNCTYQLKPNALSGRHRTLQLSTMQLIYVVSAGERMVASVLAFAVLSVCITQSLKLVT